MTRSPTNGTQVPGQPPAIPLTKLEKLRADPEGRNKLRENLFHAADAWARGDPSRQERWDQVIRCPFPPLEELIEHARVIAPELIGEGGSTC